MSARRCKGLLPILILAGCQPEPGKYFSSLTDAWAERTLEVAEPSITAALMIAGLTSELCRSQIRWDEDMVGTAPPLSSALLTAMGSPVVDSISTSDDLTEVYLREVHIMDRDAASIRIVPTTSASSFSLTAEVQDGRDGQTFGSLTFTISDSCNGSPRWVTGSAKWTDLSSVEHTIAIPSDETDIGLKFDCAYVPNDGTLSWAGTIDNQVRRFSTAEAAEIDWVYSSTARKKGGDSGGSDDTGDTGGVIPDCESFSGVQSIEWAGTVSGGQDDWSAPTFVDILYTEL